MVRSLITAFSLLMMLQGCSKPLTAEELYEQGNQSFKSAKNKEDFIKARDSYEKAAAQGHVPSMVELGYLYAEGRISTGKGGCYNITDVFEPYLNNRAWRWDQKLMCAAPNDPKAIEWFGKAAEKGDPEGQYMLGRMYRLVEGKGKDKVPLKACEWYEKAANQGHVEAQYELGGCYFFEGYDGPGNADSKQDETLKPAEKACDWYEKAAVQGHQQAQIKIAKCYGYGDVWGVKENHAKAVEWNEKIAARVNDKGRLAKREAISAMLDNGYFYKRGGFGLEQNGQKAVEWFEKAAALGNLIAAAQLAQLYETGEIIEKDEAKAREWREKAAALQ